MLNVDFLPSPPFPQMTTLHRGALAAALLATCAITSRAQCPDGAPPPCKSAVPAVIRRANPPLNPRAWIVVPFGNVMKAAELDWLRDASVNLLTLDMSRWTDVSVVPDKRVGETEMLVMGDFFRLRSSLAALGPPAR
jgi:hypothetical protein